MAAAQGILEFFHVPHRALVGIPGGDQGPDETGGELFAGYIGENPPRLIILYIMGYGLNQVGLSQAHTAMNEKGIG